MALINGAASAQAVAVPSGNEIALFDVIIDESPKVARFRFVAPALAADRGGLQFEDVAADLDFLCAEVVLPALVASAQSADTIIISLSEQEIAFGTIAPDLVQFFQPFNVTDGTCMWEDF